MHAKTFETPQALGEASGNYAALKLNPQLMIIMK